MNSDEENFCKRYQATVGVGRRHYCRLDEPVTVGIGQYDYILEQKEIKRISSVVITMPEDRYKAMLEREAYLNRVLDPTRLQHLHPADQIMDDFDRECRIRHEHPTVMKAYEKYINLLNLVRSNV